MTNGDPVHSQMRKNGLQDGGILMRSPLTRFLPKIAALLAGLMMSTCSNPVADQKKGPLVRTIINAEKALQPGRYMIYWDGKDNAKKTVAAGAYVCFMEAENDIESIEMKAVDGTKGKPADSTGTGLGYWYLETKPLFYLLEQNFPNPFYAKDGTNISFEIPEPAYIKLTIHSK
jgi:hypothetical protein